MTTPTELGVIKGVAVGSYGHYILITLTDLEGNIQDLSAYTGTKLAVAVSPDKRKTVTATMLFNTDGSNGEVKWAWADGDIDRSGDWEIQLVFNKAGGRLKTYLGKMAVIRQLKSDG